MQLGQPSRTAMRAAAHRAVHQILERGSIFSDPLALRMLGQEPEDLIRDAEEHPSRRLMRIFIAVRTRFAEDALAKALKRGVRQIVVLGAGLDTYAYRSNHKHSGVRIFEVDHPATQAWKRQRLEDTRIPVPDSLVFAPIDFERETLPEGLAAAGFSSTEETFFTWLGVVPYLTQDAIWSTLAFIASLPASHVIFDYSDPPELLPPALRELHDRRAAHVAELGETWISYFEAEKLREGLLKSGFTEVEDLGPADIAARYFPSRARVAGDRGGHIVRASKLSAAAIT